MSKEQGLYMISAVAARYDIHPQTLRLYEREGLLRPSRSDGNTRLYSEQDLERLETILNLRRNLGVNLAGVEVILNMKQRMEKMQKDVDEIVEFLRDEMQRVSGNFENKFEKALVRAPRRGIIKIPIRKPEDR